MLRTRNILTIAAAVGLIPACSGELPTRTDARAGGVDVGTSAAAPDIEGSWEFSERIWVLQPSELNPVINGPIVEKPMTQVVCESEGTIEIDQDGATFDGTATQSVECVIDGFPPFVPPDFAFNPEFTINRGELRGRSIRFETGHTLNVCDNRGSVRVENGSAIEIKAVGDCPVPFHPGEHHSRWMIRRVE